MNAGGHEFLAVQCAYRVVLLEVLNEARIIIVFGVILFRKRGFKSLLDRETYVPYIDASE